MSRKICRYSQGDWVLSRDRTTGSMKIETADRDKIAIIPTPVYIPPKSKEYVETGETDLPRGLIQRLAPVAGIPPQMEKNLVIEGLANAVLISKAPEMYRLLKLVFQKAVMEHLMTKYVAGEEDTSAQDLLREISRVLNAIDEGAVA